MTGHFREQEDEGLLIAILETRSHAAFSELVERHALRFRSVAYRFTGNRHDAEDLVQDAFLKLWNRPEMWDGSKQTKFTTWFYRIVVNQCLDLRKKRRPEPLADGQDFVETRPSAETIMDLSQQERLIDKALASLPVNMQTALNLSFFEPVPNREAAEVMGLSVKAFQSLLMRAKRSLKDKVLSEMGRHFIK